MAKQDEELARAERHFRKREYGEAAALFTKALFRTGENGPIYTRLGLCHVYGNDFAKAEYYFDKALSLDPYDKVALMSAAYLDLLADRESTALHKYTQLLAQKYEKKRIRRILDGLRLAEKARDFAALQSADFFLSGKGFPWKFSLGPFSGPLGWVILGMLLVGGLSFVFWPKITGLFQGNGETATSLLGLYENLKPSQEKKPGESPLEKIYLYDLSNNNKDYSSEGLLVSFEEVKKDIARRHINPATVKINRVLLSDSNLLIKEKFRLLESMIPNPNFAEFKNDLKMRDLIRDRSYEKVFVKYQGRAASVRSKTNMIFFDFTFADEGETWTAEVRLEKAPGLRIDAGRDYVLLGQYRGLDPSKRKPVIEARVIKQFVTGVPK